MLEPSHTTSNEWQSFEVRMRRRRAERCLLRAEAASEAGFEDDALAALAEACRIDPDTPGLFELQQRLALPRLEPPPPRRTWQTRRLLISIAAGLMLGAAIAWNVNGPLSDDGIVNAPEPVVEEAAPRVPDNVVSIRYTDVVPFIHQAPLTPETQEARAAVGAPERPEPPASTAPPPEPMQMAAAEPTQMAAAEPPPRPAPVPAPDLPVARMELPASMSSEPPPVVPAMRAREPEAVRTREPEPAVSAASAAPPPPPSPDPRAQVRSVLSRFEAAYSGLDASAAHAVWPGVDRDALKRAFNGLESQNVSLGPCDVTVEGSVARAECVGSATWTPKVGSGRTEARRWAFDLKNASGLWQIVRTDVRAVR